ncbi:MAG: NTP transferase domain-containing protein [Janthinobacterium lividum]
MSTASRGVTAPCAVILAAGVGRRLHGDMPEWEQRPKSLLAFDGRTLLDRHVAVLRAAGVQDITVVTGFQAGEIEAALAALQDGTPVRTILNPDFREGSVVSLWCARDVLAAGGPVLLMDADVLCDFRLVARLLDSPRADCLLLDRDLEPGDEPVKVCVSGTRIADFHKRPTADHDWHGESVGFFRLSAATAAELAGRAGDYVSSGRRHMEYEEPLRDMMLAHADRFGFEDITGLPWTEIDFPADVEKARALLPELAA